MIQVRYSDDVRINGIKMMVYGASGVGKTPLLATGPVPIILSGERGLLSISRTRTAYIEIRNYADLTEAYSWCARSQEAQQYWTIGLDSLTELAEVILVEEKRKTKDPRKAYGELQDQVISMVKGFRDLPGKNVVLIAKETYDKDESTGTMLYSPMFPGQKLSPKLPYYFDEVFRMLVGKDPTTGKIWRALHTQASYQHTARDRSGNLAEYEPPDLMQVFKKILNIT